MAWPACCSCRSPGGTHRPGCGGSHPASGSGSRCSRRSAWSASTWPCSPPNAAPSRRYRGSSWAAPPWWWRSSFPYWRDAGPGGRSSTVPFWSPPGPSPCRAGAGPTAPESPSPPARWPARSASLSSRCPCCARSGPGCCPPSCAGWRPWSRRWPGPSSAATGSGVRTRPRPPRCCGRRLSSPSSVSCAGTWACSGSAPSAPRSSPVSSPWGPPAPRRWSAPARTGRSRPWAAPWWAWESRWGQGRRGRPEAGGGQRLPSRRTRATRAGSSFMGTCPQPGRRTSRALGMICLARTP